MKIRKAQKEDSTLLSFCLVNNKTRGGGGYRESFNKAQC